MPYDFNDIARRYFEEIKPLFVNVLRARFALSYDDIMDIYTEVWMDVRHNILEGRVRPDTAWSAYIIKMGTNKAANRVRQRPQTDSIDDEAFDRQAFERACEALREEAHSLYEDPELKEILAEELVALRENCHKLLMLYYFGDMSMCEIAEAMNYSNANTAKTSKNRCMDRLKTRMRDAAHRIFK